MRNIKFYFSNLFTLLSRYRLKVFVAFFIKVLATILTAITFVYYGKLIDAITNKNKIWIIFSINVIIMFFIIIADYIFNLFENKIKILITRDLKIAYLKKIYGEGRLDDGLSSTLERFIGNISTFVSGIFANSLGLLLEITKFIVTFVILLKINVILSAITFIFSIIIFLCNYGFQKPIKKQFIVKMKYDDLELSKFQNVINHLDEYIFLNTKKYFSNVISNTISKSSDSQCLVKKSMATATALTDFVENMSMIVIYFLGICLVLQESFTLGTFVSFSSLSSFIFNNISSLSMLKVKIQEAIASGKRIEIDSLLNYMKQDFEDDKVKFNTDSIELTDFAIGYNGIVLQTINHSFKKGVLNVIVGPNGSGKTTLLNSMIGIIPKISGDIKIKGHMPNLRDYRHIFTYMSKNPAVMFGYNEEYLEHLEQEFPSKISEILKPLEFHVKEILKNHLCVVNENEFSSGEKSKIALYRTILHQGVLILDEPFSSLDATSRKILFDILYDLSNYMLIIFVSHDHVLEDSKINVLSLEN